MSEAQQQQARRDSNPLSSGSLINEPISGITGGSNRATTTERRTTTTTTTKRTIKSSDDFIPTATDIQQVRSESRTGSISSSTGTPLFSSAPTTTTAATNTGTAHQPTTSGMSSSSTFSSSSSKTTTNASTNTGNNIGQSSNTGRNWSSSTTTSSTTQQAGGGTGSASAADGLQSPLIQDTEEGRVLKLRFDVSQYEPDEIVVKTVDNRLTVQAKHEERSENRSVYREYNREFHLPDGVDIELIKSSLSKEGILTVDCPLPAPQLQGASRRIPIDRV